MKGTYSRAQMAEALSIAGIGKGDVVFSHSNIGYFGFPEEGRSREAVFESVFGAFMDVLGSEGTIVLPTFTYSFCKGEPFDPDVTPSVCGIFAEMLRRYPGVFRSDDPIFSVAAFGKDAQSLTSKVSAECFGKDSFWDRLLKADGIICNLNLDAGSTFIHYVERCLNVPYRYDKLFPGDFIFKGRVEAGAVVYFCRDRANPDTLAAFEPFDDLARQRGIVRSVAVGRGAIVALRAADAYGLIENELKVNPWLLTVAAKTGKTPVLLRPPRTGLDVSLPENASAMQIVESLSRLPRNVMSDGYDAALEALARQIPMSVHAYPTGTRCRTWLVPEKWCCRDAWIETLDGERRFSMAAGHLHVSSFSVPFEGVLSRKELLDRLHSSLSLPDSIPYVSRIFQGDWGLCSSQRLKDSLTEDFYRVCVRTDFEYGTLKVGEVMVRGESEDCILLSAHLGHSSRATEVLAGVAVGIQVMRELLSRNRLRYTYRLLILPETLGSVAWLSSHEALLPKIRGALFLEALGLHHPHVLELSLNGDSEQDLCFSLALRHHDPHGRVERLDRVTDGESGLFSSSGVGIPTLTLSRQPLSSDRSFPCGETLRLTDTPVPVNTESLSDSGELVLKMIDTLENNLANQ